MDLWDTWTVLKVCLINYPDKNFNASLFVFFIWLTVQSRERGVLCTRVGQLGLIAARTRLVHFLLTAGRAKKEMANTEKQDAMVFPIHVCGTLSPYPIVVTVTLENNTRMKMSPAG